ncbi:MAG: hypothetical protein RLZ62_962 [Bacteroidota bacterium]
MKENPGDKYRIFAAQVSDLPLFMQPWYLDTVCSGGAWSAATVESGCRTVAVMPFFLKKKWGRDYIAMPVLCKFMGPCLLPEFRNPDDEIRLYDALTEQLPTGLAAFEQDMNYGVTNWLPFYWKGFSQTTRYSYIIDLQQRESDIWERISRNYRRKIRKAESMLRVVDNLPTSELRRLVDLSFSRQGLKPPFCAAFLEKYVRALSENNACKLFFAIDTENNVHSAALLAWDRQSAYYIMSGDDPQLRSSGSALLLKWTAVMYAKKTLNLHTFDFEGSMIRAIEAGRRDFGARQIPYFRIRKEWSVIWKIGKWLFR